MHNGMVRRDGRGERPPGAESGGGALARLRAAAGDTLGATWRVLALVWGTHHALTAGLGGLTLLRSAVPASEAWLGKLLVDAVAAAVTSGAGAAYVPRIVALAAATLGLAVASGLLRTLANVCQQLLQERVAIRVQLLVMERASQLDLAVFETPRFYDQLQQAQRESSFRPVQMVSGLFGLVRTALTFLSMVALLAGLSPLVALVALLAPVPAFVASSRYGWQGFQLMRRQSPLRRLMSYLTTVLTTDTYHKELKLFDLGPYFVGRYRGLAEQYYAETRGLLLRRYLQGFGWGTLTLLATSGTYLYVALLAVAGRLTLGDLTLFTRAASSVQDDFQALLGGLSDLYEHGLYVSTLFELLAREPRVRAPARPVPLRRPFQEGIEFRGVTFTYPGRAQPALADVSFAIAPGETVAVVGRNGAGKTTLVKLLGRLYDPDAGMVLVDGHDVRAYDPTALRAQIGVIFQDYATYQLTVRENIGVGQVARLADTAAVADAARRAGAGEVVARLPDGYDTMLGKWFDGGHQLSGGEWQKVALARAFMRDAQVLVLDEPTAALDAQAEYELFARLKALAAGRTTLFISHRFSTVRMADRILVLEGGRLIEAGSHAELMALGGRYAELFDLQASSYR